MNPTPDGDLRGLFDESRRADEEAAPPFRRVLERRAAPRFIGSRWTGRALAVAAAGILAVIFVRDVPRPAEAPPGRIETWKPPTDFLLENSSTELFETIPALGSPLPDYSPLLAREKGNPL